VNRFFVPGEHIRETPRRLYARMETVERSDAVAPEATVVVLDAVDADWRGFDEDGPLALRNDGTPGRVSDYWGRCFKLREPGDDERDPFEGLPLFRVEITLKRADPLIGLFSADDQPWLELVVDETAPIEIDVFGGLFAEPVATAMQRPRPTDVSTMLDLVFGMGAWPDASETEIQALLDPRCQLTQLVAFDIGQGSANALVCECGLVTHYFDVGCGSGRNAKTRPAVVSFCDDNRPPVILSHWDTDHWAAASLDHKLRNLSWIVPRQGPLKAAHVAMAGEILKAGGMISVVAAGVTYTGNRQTVELIKCPGAPGKRGLNDTGLALVVLDHDSGRRWLLTGDAGYDLIPGLDLEHDFAAIVVPHHGADMGAHSVPPTRSSHPYARLIYSYGPDNAHGRTNVSHPRAAALAAHEAAGWDHGCWMPAAAANGPGADPVYATAHHLGSPAAHLEGVRAGWTGPPPAPPHLSGCGAVMPITQT